MRLGLVAIALAFALCAPAHAQIEVAAAGPVTGPLANYGEQLLAGARQAVADINAAGGVLGQQLVLHIGDDQCDPKQAVSVANDLVASHVVFVAGHVCSGSAIPASDVYDEEHVVMISPSATNPALTDKGGPYIFRVCGRDDSQGEVLGRFLAARFPDQTLALVHDKTTYGRGLLKETLKALRAAGGEAVMFETVTPGEKDYTALVSKLKARHIEVLFFGGYHTEAGLILRQMRDQGMSARMVGGDTLVTGQFWAITGEAGEGTLFTFAPDARRNDAARQVVARFRANGVEPSGYILYTYAAFQAWAQAATRAGTSDPAAVAHALTGGTFDTVLGEVTFNANGDVNLPPYAIYRWSHGENEQLERLPGYLQ